MRNRRKFGVGAKRRRSRNNVGGNPRQQLLDGSSVFLPLTHTAVPARGSIVPSFTRATTATGQKWDEAGYLDFTALAGEAVFTGAMRVYNQLSNGGAYKSSGLFNNWTKYGTPVVTDGIEGPTGTLSAGRLVMDAGEAIYTVGANGTGRTGQIAAWLRADAPGTIRLLASNSGTFTDCSLTTEWEQFSVPAFAMSNLDGVAVQRNGAGQLETVYVDLTQIVDITGETDQTTIRPYVSVGVESAPAYHGSMVDGVKCYDTDRSGNPISTSGSYPLVGYVPWEARTNSLLHSRDLSNAAWVKVNCTGVKDAVCSDGVPNAASTLTATGANATILQTLVLAAAARSYSVKIKRKTGTGTVSICRDGVTFTDITAEINSSTYTTVKIENTSVLNPICGIKLATSGDAVYVDRNQDEAGAEASPPIDTTTVAVARNASLLTYTGADVANIKTLACTFSRGVGVSNVGVAVSLSDNTLNEYSAITLQSATSCRIEGVDGGVLQWAQTASNAYSPGATSKAAYSFAINDIKADKDGTGMTADTSATIPTVTQLQVGHLAGLYQLNGPVNHIYGWTRNLSQSELGAVDR